MRPSNDDDESEKGYSYENRCPPVEILNSKHEQTPFIDYRNNNDRVIYCDSLSSVQEEEEKRNSNFQNYQSLDINPTLTKSKSKKGITEPSSYCVSNEPSKLSKATAKT
mmetsp:Transcript_17799/g.12750  ORF Transcript_17799/g.12750 Transcript_17799/m.12750 type:complete len:109 (+) Transcript_17799:596-922(+)